jgi:hypothetical protein
MVVSILIGSSFLMRAPDLSGDAFAIVDGETQITSLRARRFQALFQVLF